MASSRSSSQHVLTMDGLRGIAILLVVLFHYWQLSFYVIELPGDRNLEFIQYAGFLGVELFFFISAFCLFLPYASGKIPTLRHFYYRRAIKIMPSYVLALIVFGFLITDLYTSTWEHGKAADLGVHLLFLHNFWGPTHGSFNGVLWSLAVEVQFYVIFPVLAWLFRRRPFLTAAGMVGIAIAYRAWNRDGSGDSLGVHADLLPAFLDLFAFGMLAAWLVAWVRERPEAAQRIRLPFTAVALVSVVLIGLLFDWVYQIRFGTPAGIWQSENRPYLGALFMVLAVASAFAVPAWRVVLGNRVLVFFSTISYNLYIWHQITGVFIIKRGLWAADTPTATDDPTWRWSFMLVAIGSSIAIASLITYLFERPLLYHGVRGTWERAKLRAANGGRLPAGVAAKDAAEQPTVEVIDDPRADDATHAAHAGATTATAAGPVDPEAEKTVSS